MKKQRKKIISAKVIKKGNNANIQGSYEVKTRHKSLQSWSGAP